MKFSRRLTLHAKERLFERYGIDKLPNGRPIFVCRLPAPPGKRIGFTRRVYKINEVYFVLSNRLGRIITFLTKEMVEEQLKGEAMLSPEEIKRLEELHGPHNFCYQCGNPGIVHEGPAEGAWCPACGSSDQDE